LSNANSAARLEISGDVKVINAINGTSNTFSMNYGSIEIDSSCTTGDINVAGVTIVTDNSNGTVVTNNAINPHTIRDSVWGASTSEWSSVGTLGGTLTAATYRGAIYIDKDGGTSGYSPPIGTDSEPSNNLADAFLISSHFNFHQFVIRVAATPYVIDRDFINWQFHGWDDNANAVVNLDGYTMHQCSFEQLYLMGTVQGFIVTNHCYVESITGLEGSFYETVLVGNHSVGNYSQSQIFAYKAVGGFNGQPTTIDFLDGNNGMYFNGDYLSGDWIFTNSRSGDVINLGFTHGTVKFDASCTGGTVLINGNCDVINESDMAISNSAINKNIKSIKNISTILLGD
jgi:hypothetical protein